MNYLEKKKNLKNKEQSQGRGFSSVVETMLNVHTSTRPRVWFSCTTTEKQGRVRVKWWKFTVDNVIIWPNQYQVLKFSES